MRFLNLIKHYYNVTIHKIFVFLSILTLCRKMIWRGIKHDLSKYRWSEAKWFLQTSNQVTKVKYDSPEYQRLIAQIQPGIDLHYTRNSHHPEHWNTNFYHMKALDELEMVCDWIAAVRKNPNGNLKASLIKNTKRFSIDSVRLNLYRKLIQELTGETWNS